VEHNVVMGNGVKGEGAGILVAAAAPGMASYDNEISDNVIAGNGMAGVTVHSHTPNQDVSGNLIADNDIGRNNLVGDPDVPAATGTTGIVVFSAVVPTTEVVRDNDIHDNRFPVVTAGNVTIG
jgi:hypothetical protein